MTPMSTRSVDVFASINSLFQNSFEFTEIEKKKKQVEILCSLLPEAPT